MSLIEPGLVLICRHLVRKSSTDEMRVCQDLLGRISLDAIPNENPLLRRLKTGGLRYRA